MRVPVEDPGNAVSDSVPFSPGDPEPQPAATGDIRRCTLLPPARYVFAALAFLGLVNFYLMRVSLSVAIVVMVNTTATVSQMEVNTSNECQTHVQVNLTTQEGEFYWDADLQGLILGSFYYGYTITQIPGGYVAERWGGKNIYGVVLLINGIFSLLTPVITVASVYGLISLRVLEGLTQGFMMPAMTVCMSKWLPPLETSRFGTFIHSGAAVGIMLTFPISGVLITSGLAGGWPSVFYVFGGTACMLAVFWFMLVHESPAQHPRISKKERFYIEEAIGRTRTKKKKHPFPVFSVMKSTPFWAIAAAHISINWAYYTLLATLPIYMSEVLRFDLSQNGLFSTFPYLAILLSQNTSGYIADSMRKRGFSTTFVRKLFNTVGQAFMGIFLIAIGFVGCSQIAAVLMLIAANCGYGMTQTGHNINHLDIAPRFAGTLYGITNMIATIPGMVGPTVAGAFTEYNSSSSEWQKVFLLSAGIDLVGGLIYLIFASGEEQPWAEPTFQPADKTSGYKQTWDHDDNIHVLLKK